MGGSVAVCLFHSKCGQPGPLDRIRRMELVCSPSSCAAPGLISSELILSPPHKSRPASAGGRTPRGASAPVNTRTPGLALGQAASVWGARKASPTKGGQLLEVEAGAWLAQQVQAVVQQLAAGHRVEVLQLLDRYFRLYYHNAQNKGRVLDL